MPTLSFHAAEKTEQTVRSLAAQQGVKVSSLVGQLVEEGLAMRRFPGLIFRDGPTGRRAAIAGSLDVWEIIAILQEYEEDEEAVLTAYPSLTPVALKTARAYTTAYPQEIETRVARSRESEDEARAVFPALFLAPSPRPARELSGARTQAKRPGKRTGKR
jgi:uncharacterized protein (DUF433 family)